LTTVRAGCFGGGGRLGLLDQLRKGAREEGMKMLYDSALDKVRQGLTSLEAALTVTMADEE
jgi:type IV pilus assembly protein PilB